MWLGRGGQVCTMGVRLVGEDCWTWALGRGVLVCRVWSGRCGTQWRVWLGRGGIEWRGWLGRLEWNRGSGSVEVLSGVSGSVYVKWSG